MAPNQQCSNILTLEHANTLVAKRVADSYADFDFNSARKLVLNEIRDVHA